MKQQNIIPYLFIILFSITLFQCKTSSSIRIKVSVPENYSLEKNINIQITANNNELDTSFSYQPSDNYLKIHLPKDEYLVLINEEQISSLEFIDFKKSKKINIETEYSLLYSYKYFEKDYQTIYINKNGNEILGLKDNGDYFKTTVVIEYLAYFIKEEGTYSYNASTLQLKTRKITGDIYNKYAPLKNQEYKILDKEKLITTYSDTFILSTFKELENNYIIIQEE